MTLSIRSYIERAAVADMPVAYDWDDEIPETTYASMDERIQHRIAKTTFRGVMALAAGFAEWVAWRHAKTCSEPMLLQKIEATWAGIVSFHYFKEVPLPRMSSWEGPIRGAIWSGVKWLDDIVDLTRRDQPAYPEVVCVAQLAEYVMPNAEAFKQWRRFVIGHLAKLYPREQSDSLGAPVPREVLDPDFKYNPDQGPALINAFLSKLDPEQNPYLCSAKEMLDKGFTGTPYVYP